MITSVSSLPGTKKLDPVPLASWNECWLPSSLLYRVIPRSRPVSPLAKPCLLVLQSSRPREVFQPSDPIFTELASAGKTAHTPKNFIVTVSLIVRLKIRIFSFEPGVGVKSFQSFILWIKRQNCPPKGEKNFNYMYTAVILVSKLTEDAFHLPYNLGSYFQIRNHRFWNWVIWRLVVLTRVECNQEISF